MALWLWDLPPSNPYPHLSESEREVAPSCPTLCDSMDCSPPGSSVHGILQERILEWVAIPFSRGSSRPGIEPRTPTLQADTLPSKPAGNPRLTIRQITGKGHSTKRLTSAPQSCQDCQKQRKSEKHTAKRSLRRPSIYDVVPWRGSWKHKMTLGKN